MRAPNYKLFGAEGLDRVDGGRTACGNDTGEKGADCQCKNCTAQHKRIPAFYVEELVSDELRAADGDGNADEKADQDLQEGPAQHKPDHASTVGTESHTHADFAGATFHGIGSDAIETYCS